jgi:hypothetical protein
MARKSKGFSDLLAETQIQQGIEPSMRKLGKKVKKVFGEDIQLLRDQPGLASMSEALEELVEPYLQINFKKNQLESMFSLGVLAWNLSIMDKKSSQEMLDEALLNGMKGLGTEAIEVSRFLVTEMIQRKKELFPDNNRMIMHFDLHPAGSGRYNISVASSMPQDQMPKTK